MRTELNTLPVAVFSSVLFLKGFLMPMFSVLGPEMGHWPYTFWIHTLHEKQRLRGSDF